jgi:hypothetical protein
MGVFLVVLEMAAWAVSGWAGGRALRRAALNFNRPWCFREVAVIRNSCQLFQLVGYQSLRGMVEVLSAGSGAKQTLLGVRFLGARRTM